MMDSFIPAELAVAPNPLGLAPNLKLTTIPVDAYTCFELWLPIANAILMRAEATLLMEDCSRLEEICAKLIWLIGARLVDQQEPRYQRLTHDWSELRQHLQQAGLYFNAIAVNYEPQTIAPTSIGSGDSKNNLATTWTWRPVSWRVNLFNLSPASKGFTATTLPISLVIAGGEAITKTERYLPAPSHRVVLT